MSGANPNRRKGIIAGIDGMNGDATSDGEARQQENISECDGHGSELE